MDDVSRLATLREPCLANFEIGMHGFGAALYLQNSYPTCIMEPTNLAQYF